MRFYINPCLLLWLLAGLCLLLLLFLWELFNEKAIKRGDEVKKKVKRKKETIRMYASIDNSLIYFIKDGEEIGFIDIYKDGCDDILQSSMPCSESQHKKYREFIGEL